MCSSDLGPMSATEMAAFRQLPYWQDAVALRRIDERAKDPSGPSPSVSDFAPEILQSARLGAHSASITSP